MSMTDPIADFLTRIRNALGARHSTCEISKSRMKEELARILADEGYIEGWESAGEGPQGRIVVKLKYGAGGGDVIQGLQRVSRPGRRVYCGSSEVPKVLNGLGVAIVSTSRGIMTDEQARSQKLGGEVLCEVW